MVPGFEDTGLIEFAKNPENRRKGIVLALYGTGNAPSRRKGCVRFLFVFFAIQLTHGHA